MSYEEFVDLVNGGGEVVRTAVLRTSAEKLQDDGLHIPIIGCVIMNSLGEVLVHERPKGKRFEGCLDHVYGAIESGESPEDAAARECIEEVGVRVKRIQRINEKLNPYKYYLYTFAVVAEDELDETNREESWAEFFPVDELRSDNETGKRKFSPNFFIDLDEVLTNMESS